MNRRATDRCAHREAHIEPLDGEQHGCVGVGLWRAGYTDERTGCQQLPGIGLLWIVEHVEDRCLLDDVAVLQNGHVVGHLADDPEIVADPHHRRTEIPLQIAHQIDDLGLRRDVQRRGRLIGDQQFGIASKRDRDHHTLPLPARELMRIGAQAVLRFRQPDGLDQLECACARLSSRHLPMSFKGFRDLPLDCQQGIQ